MADLMQERGVDLLQEDFHVSIGIVPDIFQPEPDARGRRFRGSLVEVPQGVWLDPGGYVLGIRVRLQENGRGIHPLADLSRQAGQGGMNLRLRKL